MFAAAPNKVKQRMIRDLTYEGKSVAQIASITQVDRKSVAKWVEHFKSMAPPKEPEPTQPIQPNEEEQLEAPKVRPRVAKPGPMPTV